MNKIIFYLSGVFLMIMSCSSVRIKKTAPFINQGIEGYIYFVSGNQMPSPNRKPSLPKGIRTVLYIYHLTNINQVTRQGQSVFYSFVNTIFIAKTESDTNGYFKVHLEPGRYSLFTKKGALFYARIFDKDNNIAPAEVFPGKLTKVKVSIDYDATY
jgi:hypothetical protein